jgi:hypothetical protein
MLTLFRRHIKKCPHRDKGRAWKRCKCPIWVDGAQHGIDIRKGLKTTSWEEAEHKLREMKESATLAIEQPRMSLLRTCRLSGQRGPIRR